MTTRRPPSGRPELDELAPYAAPDVAQVEGDDIVAALAAQETMVVDSLRDIPDERADWAYAAGKWTVRQIVGHLSDDERIYAYRLLCIARGEPAPLPGFDEELYVRMGGFESRSMADLLAEYSAVRRATLALLQSLDPAAWVRRGSANGFSVTPRGLAFHIAGHELHHLRVLADRYGIPTITQPKSGPFERSSA